MNLTFRQQLVLTPIIIIVVLAGLVSYTLFELSEINRGNESTRQWEIIIDRIQTAIASANRIRDISDTLSSSQNLQQDDQFFSYLEQFSILADSLFDPLLFEQLPRQLQETINENQQLLREPEKIAASDIQGFVTKLLPALEYQYKLYAAQRRSVFIDAHKKLVNISSRMTIILAAGIFSCILLASVLTWWALTKTRRRLNELSKFVCGINSKNINEFKPPKYVRDELDELERCFSNMTDKLINVINIENVMQGAEDERRRIAMEIHDGVLADLTVIYRKLETMTPGQERLQLQQEVNELISNLRRTIDDLHPQTLDTLGLEPALRSYLNRHASTPGFPDFHFDFAPQVEQQLSATKKLNLFRIVTEAVNNIIKHSRCERFEISLRVVSDNLHISIEDNGIGLSNIESSRGHGYGNIVERARLIGANIQWRTSRFASGTCFNLVMPISASPNQH